MLTMKIGIIDSKICNIVSVTNAIKKLGFEYIASSNPKDLADADKLILPGVGSFDEGIKNLKKFGLYDFLVDSFGSEKKILGICLGMQLFFERSEEGKLPGLGLIPGQVKKFSYPVTTIPHIGWNSVHDKSDMVILKGIDNKNFYFIHSFYVESDIKNFATTEHEGFQFISAAEYKNISCAQFHPEKSQDFGFKLLRNFIDS